MGSSKEARIDESDLRVTSSDEVKFDGSLEFYVLSDWLIQTGLLSSRSGLEGIVYIALMGSVCA